MAAPTPTIATTQIGHYGVTRFKAVWANTDNYTDQVVVDLSALTTYTTNLQVRSLTISASPGLAAFVEYDEATDVLIGGVALGGLAFYHDFTRDVNGLQNGLPLSTGAASTGDILVTTLSAAAEDELYIVVDWYAN
jgi:hypothetical protein